jgi:protein-disulfide isomerase-like protein with CxxC motif
MPEPADWAQASDNASLAHCLEALQRAPREHARTIESFIATQDLATPAGLAVADALDRLAILMDVKSDAEADHDLARALAAFPSLIDAPADAWCSLKPALERALPPSVLRLDPAWARKRAKPGTTTAKGTWYASQA